MTSAVTRTGNPGLFDPITLRSLELPHRGWVAAMCQYSCDPDVAAGVPTDWHLVHLGQFATGGAALIITEAAAVSHEGMISPRDAGIYTQEQADAWRRINDFVHEHSAVGTKTAVQLAHAGRKASTYWPFSGRHNSVPASDGGWETLGPTEEAFGKYAAPRAMTEEDIDGVIRDFGRAAVLAVDAGFDAMEIHAAHGYLLHQFLSPLVNTRTDGWGGSEESRFRLTLEVIREVRRVIPETMPLLLRISASDWTEGGIDGAVSARLAKCAAEEGVDFVDVSSGGAVPAAPIPVGPGYQVALAEEVRTSGVPTGAVGLISDPHQADAVIRNESADVVLIARAALRDPHWWMRAAHELGHEFVPVPQYERAGGF
ncbi:2,4-dienoyl-CoA reductase-like NADH-dependent reductase (Old Yellow Enzyme family) [Arthrobacter sp. PL16]|uniref:NADH:flavin oxidoreductase/NADH oxidase n=1 Tax=Arthrobacter sp. PL16 TaxID=3071720 RepID=UPI002E01D92F|nr:2,4-dienoyl-CoA reductase-like NADH-dependent reductase (Old Yellow Enzyme family) [Arthrobacter sp. PL16]